MENKLEKFVREAIYSGIADQRGQSDGKGRYDLVEELKVIVEQAVKAERARLRAAVEGMKEEPLKYVLMYTNTTDEDHVNIAAKSMKNPMPYFLIKLGELDVINSVLKEVTDENN